MATILGVNHAHAVLTLFMPSLSLLLRQGDGSHEMRYETILYNPGVLSQRASEQGRFALNQELEEHTSWHHEVSVPGIA